MYFPGSGALHVRALSSDPQTFIYDFLLRSGRAVMFPVYKSTYERGDGVLNESARESNLYRDHVVMWAKDLRRSLDYVETRPDIDSARFAYYGLSWGGSLGGLIPAIEPRLKVVVLNIAGLVAKRSQPEAEPLNFLPRITVPVLMMNGRYDDYFPVGTSQYWFFRLLGTPEQHKRRVIAESGHLVPLTQVISETLVWLDRYLGPVRWGGGAALEAHPVEAGFQPASA